MVKLIKLQGSKSNPFEASNGTIQNTFSDSIMLKPNSRIALRSVQLSLNTDEVTTSIYSTPSDASLRTYKYHIDGGINSPFADVVVPTSTDSDAIDGNYTSASRALFAMQEAANSTAPPSASLAQFSGVHHEYSLVAGNTARLETYKANKARADFTQWVFLEGSPTVTLNSLNFARIPQNDFTDVGTLYTATPPGGSEATLSSGAGVGMTVRINSVDFAGGVDQLEIVESGSGYVAGEVIAVQQAGSNNDCLFELDSDFLGFQANQVPLVRNEQTFTIEQVGSFTWALSPIDDDGSLLAYGIGVDNLGNYFTIINGAVASPGIAANANDEISLLKNGKQLTVKATRAGAVVVSRTGTLGDNGSGHDFVKDQNLGNFVLANLGSSAILTDGMTQTLELEAGSDVGINHNVKFEAGGATALFRDLGFTAGTKYSDTGAPTQTLGTTEAIGLIQKSGVIVAIEGLDLDTYIGNSLDSGKRGGVNILDVLFADPSDPRVITQQISFPMPLDLKIQRETVIRDLRIRFLNNELKPVAFVGQPSVVLEVYGPDEST